MRKVINKSTAIRAVLLIFALIGILSIFPARLYTRIWQAPGGGELTSDTIMVHLEHQTSMQEFVAQYERLSSIDVYISEMERGRYIGLLLLDETGAPALNTFVDTNAVAIPGYVHVPMEVNLEVGKSYAVKMQTARSKFFVGTEDIRSEDSYLGNLTEEYQPVEGRHLAARYNYRIPMSKAHSLLWIAGIAALAVLACLCVDAFYKKHPEKNTILTVATVLKYVANPVAAIIFLTLMLMVFPFRVFDSRPADIIFYEVGLIVAAAITFYAINHKVVTHDIGVSFWQTLKNEDRLQYVLMMFSIAMGLWYASEYMNGLYDIYHSISEKHMTIWLLIGILLTFKIGEAFNLYNLVWVIGSGIYGIHYYNLHKIAETENEADLQNIVLRGSIIIYILGGLIVLNFIRLIVLAVKKKKLSAKPSVFGVIIAVFFVAIIVLRNTRMWGIYLALLFTALFIRLAVWDKKKDYYKILAGGLMMNYGISMLFSLMHRYFTGYTLGRFAFIFHTVTVTAEYFTFMGVVATVLLVVKIVSLPKESTLKDMIVIAWKEIVLFGFIMSYAIFTVSRTGYLAIIASIFLILCVVLAYYGRNLFRIILMFALSLVLCFPAAFTLQRIIPTMVADPVIYPIDETDEFVKGGADWDSTNFMCVERFVNLFEAKVLGMDVGAYEYPIDRYNYDSDGNPLYDNYGFPMEETIEEIYEGEDYGLLENVDSDKLLASSSFTRAEYHMLLEEMADYVDDDNALDVLSNGRITIFKSYIQELNMFGHEEMGAMLPNGEIAVHAHNTFIQVAYDHGIVGGACFILMMAAALASSLVYFKNNRKKEMLSLITCAMIIGFAVAGMSEWVFHYCNPMTVALMLSIAPLTFKAQENE